jgi:antitoxin (DNA-binding transcriptional repressor) of toxin-antitoxin stability system
MYSMKSYRVAEARAKFGTLLDEAESGDDVVIERDGVRFRLEAARPERRRAARARAPLAFVDADVLSGSWTWSGGAKGVSFRRRKARS